MYSIFDDKMVNKYKIWDSLYKRMSEPYLLNGTDIRFKLSEESDILLISLPLVLSMPSRFELLAYSQNKDMKGNEIYIDDIIECEYYDRLPTTKNSTLVWRGVCTFGGDGFHVYRKSGGYSTYSIRYGGSAIKRFEVIGNIKKEPLLLKTKFKFV